MGDEEIRQEKPTDLLERITKGKNTEDTNDGYWIKFVKVSGQVAKEWGRYDLEQLLEKLKEAILLAKKKGFDLLIEIE